MADRPVAFVMEPVDELDLSHDTTVALMAECTRRGRRVVHATVTDVVFLEGAVQIEAADVEWDGARPVPGVRRHRPLDEMAALFVRKNPPMDSAYLHATQLLDLYGGNLKVVNAPRGLREANEKLFALRFPDLLPPTVVSASSRPLLELLETCEHGIVLKPVDGFGGMGITWIQSNDKSAPALIEQSTANGARAVIGQAFLPDYIHGDKRILLLDGEPIGAVLRIPPADDIRCNLRVGGTPRQTRLGDRDREICDQLAPVLRELGLSFVGIDVIGGFLTEVNVTSPTGLREINALDEVRLEERVIDFVLGH